RDLVITRETEHRFGHGPQPERDLLTEVVGVHVAVHAGELLELVSRPRDVRQLRTQLAHGQVPGLITHDRPPPSWRAGPSKECTGGGGQPQPSQTDTDPHSRRATLRTR